MCVYVCVCVCAHMCVGVYIYTHKRTHVWVHIHTRVYTCMCHKELSIFLARVKNYGVFGLFFFRRDAKFNPIRIAIVIFGVDHKFKPLIPAHTVTGIV